MRTRLLVLGGTSFLGRAVAVAAVRRGFDVATLTRGRTGSPVPGATALHAHRGMPDQLDAVLAGRSVDVVVDTTCQRSGWAALAAERLAAVRSYVFVSTLYAYRDLPPGPVTAEDAPLHPPGGTGYGPMKAGRPPR